MDLKGRPDERATEIAIGAQRRPKQANLQRRRIRWISDKCIAEHPRESIGRPAERHAETAMIWPAAIDHQRLQSRFEYVQAHAKARIAKPFEVSASRSARTKATAC